MLKFEMLNFVKFSRITSLCLVMIFCAGFAVAEPDPALLKDVTIVVSSCDKYSQFWQPFFQSLWRNWPELNTTHKDVKIHLIANKKRYFSPRIEMINIPDETSWSDNMQAALNKINTKYILLFLDDYWLNAPVDQARLGEIIRTAKNEDVAYVQLFVDSNEAGLKDPVKWISGVFYKKKFQDYRTSLQLALWETAALKQVLRSGESAWDFEIAGSIRSSGYPKPFLTLKSNAPITYMNASHQGHITPQALALAQQMDPTFVNAMPVLQEHNWRLYLKQAKHRANSVVALIKRNLPDADGNTYRYTFEDKK